MLSPTSHYVCQVESTDFKVTRITKTKIVLGDRQKTCRDNYSIHRGSLDGQPVSIHVIRFKLGWLQATQLRIFILQKQSLEGPI